MSTSISTSGRSTGTRRRRTATRLLATVAALSVLPALLVGFPAAASTAAANTTDRSDAAAGWLGRQLSADHVVLGAFGADLGLTADVVLALDSAGVGKRAAQGATTSLRAHVLDYTGGGDPKEFYAGSFAKLLNVAAAQNVDPRHFGGSARNNLVHRLRSLECGSDGRVRHPCFAKDDGRFSDISAFGDFSNTIGQSLALIGLERTTKKGPSTGSVSFLRRQQCANGAFPLLVSTPGCVPSADATSFAVQALLAVGGADATAAAFAGARWLERHQNGNGSFTGNGVPNTNTTGLASQALLAAGHDLAAAKADRFIRSLQVGCGGKAKNRGEVHYAKHAAGDSVRATAQAVPALAGVGLADIDSSGSTQGLPTLGCS